MRLCGPQLLLVIVLGDALEYAYHRLSHTCPALWRVHAIHHTSVRMNALKGARHHVLYALGRRIAVWTPLLLLGAPAGLVYWQYIAVTITGLVSHSNVAFRISALVHRIIVTPDFHRIHHAADMALGNSNFGTVFAFWDLVFGTHSDPLRVGAPDAGIQDDQIPRRFMEELNWPWTGVRHVQSTTAAAA